MTITVTCTQSAQSHFYCVVQNTEGAKGIYFALKKAGCAGYMYVTEARCEMPEDSVIVAGGEHWDFYIPKDSLQYLDGTTIDLIANGALESKLAFDNPNVTTACGCGESVELVVKK